MKHFPGMPPLPNTSPGCSTYGCFQPKQTPATRPRGPNTSPAGRLIANIFLPGCSFSARPATNFKKGNRKTSTMTTPDDKTFLEQLNRHLGIACKISRAYQPDPDERADLLQEMIYQLWRSYPTFTGKARFSTWMYSVCLNTALADQRKTCQRKHQPLVALYEQIPDPPPDPREETTQGLFDAITTLPPLNKAIVLLYLDGLSYGEIATITGLSKANVSVRLVRIKRELETRLTKHAHAN